jgi:peroxiredoxin
MSEYACRVGRRVTLAVGQSVPAALAAATVLDAAGEPRALARAWAARDALLVFVRHFGCAGCSAHVAALRPRLDELVGLDVAIVVVGNGNVDQLAAFIEREKLAGYPIDVFTDPTLAAYRAAGCEQSWLGTFGPRALAAVVGLAARGFSNGRFRGDVTQQGGTLYVTRAGVLAFRHRSARIGDNARLVDVVDIALTARASEQLAKGLA